MTAAAPDLRSETVPRNIHSVTCNLSWPYGPKLGCPSQLVMGEQVAED